MAGAVAVVAFTDLLAGGLVVPVLAPYLGMIGASHVTIGVNMSSFLVLQLLSSALAGRWASRKGHLAALQGSLLVCSCCYFALGSATTVPVVFLCRSVLGLLQHIQLFCGALLESESTKKWLVTLGPWSFVFGAAVAGNMMELHGGYQLTCYLITMVFFTNFSIVYFFITPPVPAEQKQESPHESMLKPLTNLLQVKWSHGLTLVFLLDFVYAAHFSNFAPVLWEVYKTAPRWIGYTMALQVLSSIVANYVALWVTYKHPLQQIFQGFVFLMFLFAALYLAPSWYFIVVCLLPLSMCCTLVRTGTSVLLERSNLTTSAQTVAATARIAAPIITGLTYDYFGFEGTAFLRATTSAAGAVVALLALKQDKKQK